MPQQYYCHIHLAFCQIALFLFQAHRVLFLDMDVFIIRYDAQYGYAANVFQHPPTFVEESHVAAELVDDDALNQLAVLGTLQHDTAINRSKHASAVDISYKNNIRLCMARHRHIHKVAILQVDL